MKEGKWTFFFLSHHSFKKPPKCVCLFMFGCWFFAAAWAFLLLCWAGTALWLRCEGSSLRWLLLLPSTSSGPTGFHGWSGWTLEPSTPSLWCMGLVAPRHVGSSWTKDWTRVSGIGRRILHHWATRKPRKWSFKLVLVLVQGKLM